jgi:hypothetical protein
LLDLQNLLLVVLCTFPLCLVNAPKLWTYINSCIKTIQLYYEVDFVVNAALNSDWVRISLFVSLGSHRYGTLEGNLAYVPVMDPGFGSWQKLSKEVHVHVNEDPLTPPLKLVLPKDLSQKITQSLNQVSL